MPNFTVERETWDQIWPEADLLASQHFAEVEGKLAEQRPYRVDAAAMKAIADSGIMWIWGARGHTGQLLGYCTWNVLPDYESAGLLIALQGAWFVAAGARGGQVGLELYKRSLDDLRKAGVANAFPHHRLEGAGKSLGKFFRRLGATETQHTYSLWLGQVDQTKEQKHA